MRTVQNSPWLAVEPRWRRPPARQRCLCWQLLFALCVLFACTPAPPAAQSSPPPANAEADATDDAATVDGPAASDTSTWVPTDTHTGADVAGQPDDAPVGDVLAGDVLAGEVLVGDGMAHMDSGATADGTAASDTGFDSKALTDSSEVTDSAANEADTSPPSPPNSFVVTGYYAGWMASHLPIDAIDFSALTTIVHFSIYPKPDGTFDTSTNGITPSQTDALVKAGHKHGVQILLGVGGSWTQEGFRAWMKPAKRADFVDFIVKQIKKGGYDGVDLDMEPVDDSDAKDFVPFVKDLRAAMDALDPGLLLTAAVGYNKAMYGPVHKLFDRINLMTYDLSGAWAGWETWHNSPLSNGGKTFASTGAPLPSCETVWADAVAKGAPKGKLGIGIVFYAYVWSGATGPNQSIAGVQVKANMPYHEMMDTLYSPAVAKWHKNPQAPYLSIGNGSSGKFVSYDNEQSISAKITWAKQNGLSGVIIWELGGGWRPNQPKGKRDLLLQAVKQAAWP
jgi:chitinase